MSSADLGAIAIVGVVAIVAIFFGRALRAKSDKETTEFELGGGGSIDS